ncbi:MAG: SigE family RNA polymerase sigma factor [Hamadaea sp.]|nr:SigE family RNA polymerase sigma factor [Hamadaea sp.]NUR47934.1 SigE family RNA polymerase sigma factor [Hamadaea sp.]NUT02025.1 SigE family RNA polymerase sigma factor [Hamadaea sp.]
MQPSTAVDRLGRVNGETPITAAWPATEEFDDFIRARHTALLRFAHVLTGDPHLAADLVQDALERTGLAWRRVRRQDMPEAYVRRAIVNGFVSGIRRRRREVLTDVVPDRAGPEGDPPDDAMWRLLATLPRQQRAVLVLRFYEDLTEVEVAEVLGCAVGTVKSNSSRALARLRAALPSRVALEGGGEHV